jgi:hypothetical protein
MNFHDGIADNALRQVLRVALAVEAPVFCHHTRQSFFTRVFLA